MFQLDPDAAAFGVTAIENRFFLDYLPAAKGDYVKVYLFGLFACQNKPDDYGLADMAQELNLSVPEVDAALRYWERRALVTRISDNPLQYRFHSPTQRQQSAAVSMQADTEYVAFAEAVYAAFGEGRKVTPGEIALAWEWVQDVGLPPETVLMLLHHCMAQHMHFSFKKAEKIAVRMKEAGVSTPEDADAFLQHDQAVHDGARKVLSRMGKRRLASDDELALYEKWIGAWGFEPQAVLDACAQTTGGDPSFKYLDGILARLHGEGDAHTGAQVKKQLEKEQDEKALAQEVFNRLGKPLAAPVAVRQYREMLAIQPHEVLLLAADECCRTHKNVEDMQALLLAWQNRGLTTEGAVREYLSHYREGPAGAFRRLRPQRPSHGGGPDAVRKMAGLGLRSAVAAFRGGAGPGGGGQQNRLSGKGAGRVAQRRDHRSFPGPGPEKAQPQAENKNRVRPAVYPAGIFRGGAQRRFRRFDRGGEKAAWIIRLGRGFALALSGSARKTSGKKPAAGRKSPGCIPTSISSSPSATK